MQKAFWCDAEPNEWVVQDWNDNLWFMSTDPVPVIRPFEGDASKLQACNHMVQFEVQLLWQSAQVPL